MKSPRLKFGSFVHPIVDHCSIQQVCTESTMRMFGEPHGERHCCLASELNSKKHKYRPVHTEVTVVFAPVACDRASERKAVRNGQYQLVYRTSEWRTVVPRLRQVLGAFP